MENKLDLSIRIWSDYYNRAESNIAEVKLMREANDLCQCFGITKEVSERGREIAEKQSGDTNVYNSKK